MQQNFIKNFLCQLIFSHMRECGIDIFVKNKAIVIKNMKKLHNLQNKDNCWKK